MRKILFLDIDGVLNSHLDHEIRQAVFDELNYVDNDLTKKEKHQKVVDICKERGVIHQISEVGCLMNMVNAKQVQMLSDLCKKHNVEVVGISAWFVSEIMAKREGDLATFEKGLKEYSEFLDLNIIDFTGSGDANTRLVAIHKWLEEHIKPNEVICIYLDDDHHFNADRYNLNASFIALAQDYPTYYAFTHGRFGINEKLMKNVDKFLSAW